MTVKERTKPQVATMNAVHDLPVLVARDRGFFKDEGLDLEFVTTPGMAQVTTSHFVKFDSESSGRSKTESNLTKCEVVTCAIPGVVTNSRSRPSSLKNPLSRATSTGRSCTAFMVATCGLFLTSGFLVIS